MSDAPRTVHCAKLGAELPGLPKPPMPGPLGQRVFDEVSQQAWQQWLEHQTRLINEYRLVLAKPDARAFLREEMEKFLFTGGELTQTGYTPPPSPSSEA